MHSAVIGPDQAAKVNKTIAIVQGQALKEGPKDLYIPPDALEVFLEKFEGPLDLLLYLIKKNNFDIRNIAIATITEQYMVYIDLMDQTRLELAGDYLVMAALLAEIKSRALLPKMLSDSDEEEDPQAELIRRLLEYEQFKIAAQNLDKIPRVGRDTFITELDSSNLHYTLPQPQVQLIELLQAFKEVLRRSEGITVHNISKEVLSLRERMSKIMLQLSLKVGCDFSSLINPEEGRSGVVVTFIALLELLRGTMIALVQVSDYGPIHIKSIGEVAAKDTEKGTLK